MPGNRFEVVNLPAIADVDEVIDGKHFRSAGEALCPQLRTLDYLVNTLKVQMGDWAFDLLLNGKPRDRTGNRWSQLIGESQMVDIFARDSVYLTLFIDPATGKSQSKEIDYSAIVATGMSKRGVITTDAVMEKTGFSATLRNAARLISRLPRHPDAIGIETNGMQGELWKLAVQQFPKWGIHSAVHAIENTVAGKHHRITRLDPLFDRFCVRFVRNAHTAKLIAQLRSYPTHEHDDGPDAMDSSIQLFKVLDAKHKADLAKHLGRPYYD